MNEETTAIAGEQTDVSAIGTQQPEIETELNTAEEADQVDGSETEENEEGDQQGSEPDLIDFEFDGKVHRIPAELKSGFMMQADYTRKTQEVAEMRKSVEAQIAEAEANFSVSEEVLGARAALMNIDAQLEQYQNVNWQQLENDDPMAAMSHWRQFQQLKEQRGQVTNYLGEQQSKRSEQAQQDTAKRLQETREFAEKEIKGWTPELDDKITAFAMKDLGLGRDEMLRSYNPTLYRTLYLAYLGQIALQKQSAAPRPAATPAQPLSKVTARANPPLAGLDDRLSADEWLKRRNAQVQKRG